MPQRAAPDDPHAAGCIGHMASAEKPEQQRVNLVAQAADARHSRVRPHSRSQHDVGVFVDRGPAHRREVRRVAGPIGIEKREQIALPPLPAFLDGRPVSPVLLEHDDVHVAEAPGRILCKFCGAIRRSVAHHENLDVVQARRRGNLVAGLHAAQERAGYRALFVQGRDHDGQAAHKGLRGAELREHVRMSAAGTPPTIGKDSRNDRRSSEARQSSPGVARAIALSINASPGGVHGCTNPPGRVSIGACSASGSGCFLPAC